MEENGSRDHLGETIDTIMIWVVSSYVWNSFSFLSFFSGAVTASDSRAWMDQMMEEVRCVWSRRDSTAPRAFPGPQLRPCWPQPSWEAVAPYRLISVPCWALRLPGGPHPRGCLPALLVLHSSAEASPPLKGLPFPPTPFLTLMFLPYAPKAPWANLQYNNSNTS